MKDYLFYQNAIGCYDKGNGAAKVIVCAGLAFFARKGYMKAKYKTIIGPSVRIDDAKYKPKKHSQRQILQMLKNYIIHSKAPVYWR